MPPVWGSMCQSEEIQTNGILIYKLDSRTGWTIWVHDNRQTLSKPLPLITPAVGKYWIFTFAYSTLASRWWYESIWIRGPADQPVLSSQLIHLLIQPLLTSSPLCSKKSRTEHHWKSRCWLSERYTPAQMGRFASFFYSVSLDPRASNPLISNDILAVILPCANISINSYLIKKPCFSMLIVLFPPSCHTSFFLFYSCLEGVFPIKLHYLHGLWCHKRCYSTILY